MSHRLYFLVTRSAALLILALLTAPLWDSWRYRGLASSGGAVFPVGAIMQAPRRAPGAAAPTAAAPTAEPGAGAALPEGGVPAAAPPATAAPQAASPVSHASARDLSGSTFEAWSARAQVDPFWNGQTIAASRSGAWVAAAGPDGRATAAAAAAPPVSARRDPRAGTRPGAGDARRAADDEEEADEEVDTEDAGTGTGAPVADGAPVVMWPIVSATPDVLQPPTPGSEPVDPGVQSSSRLYALPPRPGDPPPLPVPVPRVSARVATPEVSPADTILVAIRIDDADHMTSLPFHLDFDPFVIEFVGSQTGPALALLEPVLLASVSPNRPGDLAVGLSLIEKTGSFSGNGDVLTLHFRALAPGRTDLSFSRATLRGARSEPLEVQFTGASVTVR